MIKLKNIKKTDHEIICDIYPEDSKTPGRMAININTGEVSYQLPVGYAWCENHINHAKRVLESMSEPYPEEKAVIWG